MSNPNGTTGEHPLDDLAAYALDALDDAERQAVDDHLERCPECRSELAGHHETLAALGTTSEEAPPAAVWERVAAGIGAPGLADPHRGGPAGPAPAAPTTPAPTTPGPLRRRRLPPSLRPNRAGPRHRPPATKAARSRPSPCPGRRVPVACGRRGSAGWPWPRRAWSSRR